LPRASRLRKAPAARLALAVALGDVGVGERKRAHFSPLPPPRLNRWICRRAVGAPWWDILQARWFGAPEAI